MTASGILQITVFFLIIVAIAKPMGGGFARQSVNSIGNFWVDLIRGTFYILLPASLLAALFLCSQRVIQDFEPYTIAKIREGAKQAIAHAPVASQEAIKMLAQMGVAASMRIRLTYSRTPTLSPTSFNHSHLHHSRRPHLYFRRHDWRPARGWAEINSETQYVTVGGKDVRFTPKKFDLLHYLVTHPNTTIGHTKLLQTVWGPDYGSELAYLHVFVNQIRKKIEQDPSNPQYLLTELSVGYRFHLPRV